MTLTDAIWGAVERGEHVALLGRSSAMAPSDRNLLVLRADCDVEGPALGPILELTRRAVELLEEDVRRTPRPDSAAWWSRRRRLLHDETSPPSHRLVGALNSLQRRTRRRVTAVLHAVDAADEATLAALERMVAPESWLDVPLVCNFRAREPSGAAGALLEALRGAGAAVIEAPEVSAAAPAGEGLSAELLLVLQAAATIGPVFEAPVLAWLLRRDPLEVLELLQRAHDGGAPIEDRGAGRFALEPAFVAELRRQVLPSVAAGWHGRMADALGPELPGLAVGEPAVELSREEPAPEPGPPPDEEPVFAGEEGLVEEIFETPLREVSIPEEPDLAELFRSAGAVGAEERFGAPAEEPPGGAASEHARAARHAEAAGRGDSAVEHYLVAANRAAAEGALIQAHDLAQRGLAVNARLPETGSRRRRRMALLLELGRSRWLAAGPSQEYSLAEALEALDAAESILADDDPPELAGEIRAVTAAVCHDIGEAASLERALDLLTTAIRALTMSGRPLAAASLLNDLASVWVRIGDPVRAHRLLEISKEVFAARAEENPAAQHELAETEHLIARLFVHVKARPGREAEASEVGLRYARSAEQRFRALGEERALARVWETLGRLEAKAGRTEEAVAQLVQSIQVQQGVGDVLGLARSVAALADRLVEAGDLDQALDALSDSVQLNLEKGSPRGIAYNRRTLERLSAGEGSAAPALAERLEEIAVRLDEAERALGRAELPDSPLFAA